MDERTFDNFDEFAKDYRRLHNDNLKITGADSFYFVEQKVLIIKQNEADKNLRMLDLGCGDGSTEMFVLKHLPGWKVEGIDVSVESIKAANNKNLANAIFQIFNGTEIPFADNSFDVLYVAAVFHHIDFSLHAVLMKEVYRTLKPGGRLYLFEHNPINPFTQYLVKTCEFDKDAKLLGHKYSRRLLKAAGFNNIKIKFILFFPPRGMFLKLNAVANALSWLPLGGQYFSRCIK